MTRDRIPPQASVESVSEDDYCRTDAPVKTEIPDDTAEEIGTRFGDLTLESAAKSDAASLTLDELRASFQLLKAENSRLSAANSVLQAQLTELTAENEDLKRDLDATTKDRDYLKEKSARTTSSSGEGRGHNFGGTYNIGGSGTSLFGNVYRMNNTSSSWTNQTFGRQG